MSTAHLLRTLVPDTVSFWNSNYKEDSRADRVDRID